MSAQPIASSPLVPVVIPFGVGVGRQTKKILVNPMSGVHHCADCDYMAESYNIVRRHRADAHGKGAGRKKGSQNAPKTIEAKLTEAALLLLSVRDDLAAPDDKKADVVSADWKTRALAAEKSLKSLRRILGTGSEATR